MLFFHFHDERRPPSEGLEPAIDSLLGGAPPRPRRRVPTAWEGLSDYASEPEAEIEPRNESGLLDIMNISASYGLDRRAAPRPGRAPAGAPPVVAAAVLSSLPRPTHRSPDLIPRLAAAAVALGTATAMLALLVAIG